MSKKKAAGTLRERLLSAAQTITKKVHIPEWDETLTIRQLSAESLISGRLRTEDTRETAARDIIESVIDPETGASVFTEADIPAILGFQLKGFVRLKSAINELNGASDKEAIKKNSETSPSTPSPSDSPSA
jgi:hypothetical protein